MTDADTRIEVVLEERDVDAATGMIVRNRAISFRCPATNWEFETRVVDELLLKARRVLK